MPDRLPPPPTETSQDADADLVLLADLRRGDEDAFATLIGRYHGSLVRLAMVYVGNRAVAEEVAQETWLGVLQGIGRFEARSSLKTWLFRILTNRAKTRGVREGRTIPFSALAAAKEEDGPVVAPERFLPPGVEYAGHWAAPPPSWGNHPEERLLAGETRDRIAAAIAVLSPNQRAVITLRDVEGWSAPEVCNLLQITETNQRVLLHRARSCVRQALEDYLAHV